MPIDAEAYMAGAIPSISRGNSWVPYGTSQPTSVSGPGGGSSQHMPVSQPSLYGNMQQHALGGFFQNPLMLGRMAAFGFSSPSQSQGPTSTSNQRPGLTKRQTHDGTCRVSQSSHAQRKPLSVVTGSQVSSREGSLGSGHTGSPLRYSGWSGGGSGGRKGPGSPEQGSVSERSVGSGFSPSSAFSAGGGDRLSNGRPRRYDADQEWESGAGAPRPMAAEPDYARSVLPPGPKSLPVSEVIREEERRKYLSQPRMRQPSRLGSLSPIGGRMGEGISPSRGSFKPSPLREFSPRIQEEDDLDECTESPPPFSTRKTARFARPPMSRRHTEEYHAPPQRSRRLSIPPPSPRPSFDMQNMAGPLANSDARRPQQYMSPSADEGYDRYVAHPAVTSPTTTTSSIMKNRPEIGARSVSANVIPASKEYIPLGFARPTRDVAWNRDGPAMKTHGVAWHREADILPLAPEGPRWTQARPPRPVDY